MSGGIKNDKVKIGLHDNSSASKYSGFILVILSVAVFLLVIPLGIWGCETAGQDISQEITGNVESEDLQEEDDQVALAAVEEETLLEVRDISTDRVLEIINNDEDYVILDVRTPEEYETGHLEGALLIPVQELEDRLDELPADKPVITYCKSGQRSRQAAEILVENGFTDVYDMGGIIEWNNNGYPVEVDIEDDSEKEDKLQD